MSQSIYQIIILSTAGPGPGGRKGSSLMTIWELLKIPTDMNSPPCKLILLMSEKDNIRYYVQHYSSTEASDTTAQWSDNRPHLLSTSHLLMLLLVTCVTVHKNTKSHKAHPWEPAL